MTSYPRWKFIMVALVLIVSIIYSIPNLYTSYPALEVIDSEEINLSQVINVIDSKIKPENVISKDNKFIFKFSNSKKQLEAYNKLSLSNIRTDYTLTSYTNLPDWLNSINAYPMFLGLDLKGGVHFLLQVDRDNIKTNLLREISDEVKDLMIENKFRYDSFYKTNDKIIVNFDTEKPIDEIIKITKETIPDIVVSKITNGKEINLEIIPSEDLISRDIDSSVAKNLTILRSRVDELGVAQPILQKQGKDRIIVQLPGLQDSTRAKGILGSTATLEFRLTKGTPEDWYASKISGTPVINSSVLYKHRDNSPVLLSRKVIVAGEDIKGANSGFDSSTNTPAVFVNLSDYGASRMLETTSKNIGSRMAVIFVEKNKKEVINIAVIREAFSKSFQITGLDINEATDLAILLRSGALSAPMEIVEERTVGPSLGASNILAGKNSMYFGVFLVGLFMLAYYRLFGLIANIALVANIIIITAILSIFQATLTLSGIAGIVLTVGMAVDANVLIFERIREEITNGNTPNASIYAGYKKAFSTISDANITTLIAAIALLTIGTGAVKGFAITLVIGILSSMFTSIVGTRALVSLIYERKNNKGLSI
ncbi:MAG: protein translocase subunit SecD [Gammaproteobacteria bacterium]|nr:protein translocase subunit SecD [Gammaproteobacteria bacterium]MBT4654286.1 protein translocase subunit SecD [Gammaproteobacteria bacterium]MBT5116931.1 protein translocase subunit SecD [Gammaproteobacteria bacterium]MBT6331337.1 protein translocase subunit SecD [Gammaproteobacteria bacterium]MBT7931945.1 protein translocase subunit SecD [Gammaproteobacteria bacterium]